jgi:protein O-mannosyl-transferase
VKNARRVALGLLACGLTALVYVWFVDSPFVLDDQTTVLLNPSLPAPALRDVLLYDPWHPLLNLSFAIDYAFSGISPFGFHITNGILHLIVIALFYGLCTRILDDDWTAFFAAAAFGINPLTARSVAYVSARADLLFAAGVLLAIVFARRWHKNRTHGALAAAAICAGLAVIAAPWGHAAPGGPHRFYLTTAAALFAVAWCSRTLLARSWGARACGAIALAALILMTRGALVEWAAR